MLKNSETIGHFHCLPTSFVNSCCYHATLPGMVSLPKSPSPLPLLMAHLVSGGDMRQAPRCGEAMVMKFMGVNREAKAPSRSSLPTAYRIIKPPKE